MRTGPYICNADPDQIAQVFWNLVRNGLEAGGRPPDIGCTGTAATWSACATMGAASPATSSACSGRSQPRAGGSGLRLAIVFQIVRQHGGDLTVLSSAGQGTQFDVRLPLVLLPVSA